MLRLKPPGKKKNNKEKGYIFNFFTKRQSKEYAGKINKYI